LYASVFGIPPPQAIEPWAAPLPLLCEEAAIGLALTDFNPLNWLCTACLLAELQKLPPESPFPFQAINICAAGGDKWAFGGINGQLILSKHPIRNVKETFFEGWAVNRLNVHATIKDIRIGFGHWAFNALADADPSLAPLMYGDLQIDHAKDFVAANDDVVLGDMNSGGWYQPEGYNHLLANGYSSIFAPGTDPATSCTASHATFSLCANGRQGPPLPSDHIVIKKANRMHSNPQKSAIFFDQPLMSDHVGVRGKVWKSFFSRGPNQNLRQP